MEKLNNLWGEEFEIKDNTTQVLDKIKKSKTPKKPKATKVENLSVEKQLHKRTLALEDRLKLITQEVNRVLGKYKDSISIITSKEELVKYIDKAIKNNLIALDTETNNSLDPITCKIMGLCLYTPGMKQCYIPINHVDYKTNNRLFPQLTEYDIAEQLKRLKSVKIIYHNAKFDYKVIHCTCGVDLPIYWDTYVVARLLNENESAKLKDQYSSKIDPTQESYNIEKLFENVLYEQVDPSIFGLYSATDPYITYKLYEYQVEQFKNSDLAKIYELYLTMELPLVEVVAKMELRGISLDPEYSKRLLTKYQSLSQECNERIRCEVDKYRDQIAAWRLTPEANKKSMNKTGTGYSKSKNEQLENPVKIESPTQLAILLYDILQLPQVNPQKPRGTGVDELTALYAKTNLKLCELILEGRTLDKLLNTFIEALPLQVKEDGRIHCEFGTLSTDSGRMNSSHPNTQQIPRSNIEVKLLFRGTKTYEETKEFTTKLELDRYGEVETKFGIKKAKDLVVGDEIKTEDNQFIPIKSISPSNYVILLIV